MDNYRSQCISTSKRWVRGISLWFVTTVFVDASLWKNNSKLNTFLMNYEAKNERPNSILSFKFHLFR